MKNMASLMKIELILMKRQAAYYLLSIGLPSVFYLIFSGMMSGSDTPERVLRGYLFSMTLFSIMSSAFFSIPSTLQSDKNNNWQKMIQHSPISMVKYYISKLCSTLLTFMLSIIVVFSIGHFVRGVNLPMVDWLLIAVILLVGSVVFIAMGVLVSLLPSAQLMSVVGNIVYMALAVLGGLWFPLTMFPKWLQPIGKLTPSYQLMQVVSSYLEHHQFNGKAALIVLIYTVLVSILVLKLKQVHYMFHIALVFIIFPVAGVISGEYPLFLLLWTAIFVVSYYAVLLSNHRLIQFFSWCFLVAYIYYGSVWLNTGFTWYIFYLSNLLIYELDDVSFKSWRFWTFIDLQPAIVLTNYLMGNVGPAELLFFIVTFLFSDGLTFGLHRIQTTERIKEEKTKQNAQLNLFLAENERNRIGRDLHDSLGHTFAMLSVKAELAQQFLQMEAYEKAAKELQEVQEISKKSMADVRRIINDLKNRTLDEELVTIRAMLEMSGVQVEIDNQLNVASIPPSQQSTISMILLEAATNIIKHAKAKKSNFSLVKKNEKLVLDIQDDGCGFQKLTGRELHSIRERLSALSGSIEILSSQDPTWIRIELPYGGKEA